METIGSLNKVEYIVYMKSGPPRWGWANAGTFIDISFGDSAGEVIPIDDILSYEEASERYQHYMEASLKQAGSGEKILNYLSAVIGDV